MPIELSVVVKLFATFHSPEVSLSRLTSGLRDTRVGPPEYKVTAVRVERAPGSCAARA